jgi:hypothetical protein
MANQLRKMARQLALGAVQRLIELVGLGGHPNPATDVQLKTGHQG